jgi:hypothetical protein
MRSLVVGFLLLSALPSVAPAQGPVYLFTEPDAILCLRPENVDVANVPSVAENATVLRAMGCVKLEAGVRSRLMANAEPGARNVVKVRLLPQGIPGGVVFWGRSNAFTRWSSL